LVSLRLKRRALFCSAHFRCWPTPSQISHAVSLGMFFVKERGDRHPKVRDGVLLCAGAKVLGNVEIGRDAKVGAGSVVLQDVPPGATVAGVPARIVGWSSGSVGG
jgi:serine acetyltransferase